jgi:Mce-associated membrane protein
MTDEQTGDENAESAPVADAADTGTSKAARLEARAAKLRAREEAKAQARAERAAASDTPGGTVAAPAGRWRIAAIALAILLVASIAVDVPIMVAQSDTNAKHARVDRERNSVTAIASRYAVDFGSYDYTTLDADFARVLSHLTPSFAKNYQSVSGALKPTIVQFKTKETAAVQAVAVQSITSSQAIVLVFLDQTVVSTQSSTPRIDRNRLRVTMQRQHDGTWLISEIAAL